MFRFDVVLLFLYPFSKQVNRYTILQLTEYFLLICKLDANYNIISLPQQGFPI
jgi:hypothetical protein